MNYEQLAIKHAMIKSNDPLNSKSNLQFDEESELITKV